jgi:hypothetical protein
LPSLSRYGLEVQQQQQVDIFICNILLVVGMFSFYCLAKERNMPW